MTTILGRKTNNSPSNWTTVNQSSNNQRAFYLTSYTPSSPMFITKMGAWLKKDGPDLPRIRFAIWEPKESNPNQPGNLIAYTSPFDVSHAAVGDGTNYEADISWNREDARLGTSGAAVRLPADRKYFFGFLVKQAAVQFGQVPGTTIHNMSTNGTLLPSNPFGSLSTSALSELALYAVAEENTDPSTVITAPPASTFDTTPTIRATFVNASDTIAPFRDKVARFRLQVMRISSGNLSWDTGWLPATEAERAAALITRKYAGNALSVGAPYQVRSQVEDDVGGVSNWSDWVTFTVAIGGVFDVSSSSPLGKQETDRPGPFIARWTHVTPLSTSTVWLRINVGGVLQRVSGPIAKVVSNNNLVSIGTAESGILPASDPLPPGDYTWQMQALDAGSNLSPWSDPVAFAVNSPPNQPTNLRPFNDQTVVSRPLLQWDVSDPNKDDVLGVGLHTRVEITRPDGSKVTLITSNVDPTYGYGYFQTTGTELNTTSGTYYWRVQGYDISGQVPNRDGVWSALQSFNLVIAPDVRISSPIDRSTVSNGTPQISFNCFDGALISRFRVDLYRSGENESFYQSEWKNLSPAANSGVFPIPAGWLRNNKVYEVTVTVQTTLNLTSTSGRTQFTTVFTAANDLAGLQLSPTINEWDVEPTSVMLSWSPTGYSANEFAGYVVWRRFSSTDPSSATPIRIIRNAGQRAWTDHHPPPNRSLVYGVSQLRRAPNGDIQESNLVEDEVEIPITTPVLVSMSDGENVRMPMKFLNKTLSGGFESNDSEIQTWGSKDKPTPIRPPAGYGAETVDAQFTLIEGDRGHLHQLFAAAKEVYESGHEFELRLEHRQIYCRLVRRGKWWKRAGIGMIDVDWSMKEINWKESVDIGT